MSEAGRPAGGAPSPVPVPVGAIGAQALRADRRRLVVLWLVLAAWPLLVPNAYLQSLAVTFLINLILVASLNLAMGYAGLISLCHAAFFGLGAYISGVLNTRYGLSPWLGLPAAVVGTTAAATLIAIPTLRLRGHYLAMGTLGFSAIIGVLFVELVSLTGGPNGLIGVEPYTLVGRALDTPLSFFPLAWVAGFVVLFLLLNLSAGSTGRNLRAIAGSEVAADTLGVDTVRHKIAAFALSAGCAGVAGALYVHFNLFASPETFGVFPSVLLVVMVALGGTGHYWGPFAGALIYTAGPELLRDLHDAELLMFGTAMIVVLLYFPDGLAGATSRWRQRRRQAAAGRAARAVSPTTGATGDGGA